MARPLLWPPVHICLWFLHLPQPATTVPSVLKLPLQLPKTNSSTLGISEESLFLVPATRSPRVSPVLPVSEWGPEFAILAQTVSPVLVLSYFQSFQGTSHSAATLPRYSELLKAPSLLMIWHLILISLFMRLLQDSTYCPLEWLLLWAGLLVTMQFSFLLPCLLPRLHSGFQHHWNRPSLTFHIEIIVVDPSRARFSRLLRKLCTGGLLEPLGFRAAWTA